MYWFQRWCERIVEAVRSEASATNDALRRQIDTIRIEGESREGQRQREAGIIAGAIKEASDAASNYEKPQRNKEYRLQVALVCLTFIAAMGAIAAAIGTWWSLPELKKSADAAKGAAEIAGQQLESSRRPWISFTPELQSGLFNDINGMNLELNIRSRNTGTTPADHVFVYAKFFPAMLDNRQAASAIKWACDSATRNSQNSTAALVPGDNASQVTKIMMTPGFMNQYNNHGFLVVEIVMCAAYRSEYPPFAEYFTPERFDIYHMVPGGGRTPIVSGRDVPQSDLRIADRSANITLID